MDENRITYFAETDSRNKRTPFGIKSKDRSKHVYVIGKTGMGKSTLLENMAVQDIQNGEGMAFIDPHGKTAELLLEYVPQERIKDVVYFAPFDTEYPISFNVMEDVGANKRHLVANGLMSAFKKIWVDAWSARMEYILNNILLALLEFPDSTLVGVNRMLSDKDYRKKVVENISDPSVKSFWVDEFAKYGDKYMQEAGAAIQNKIGQFIANPLVRNIIGQPKSSFDLRKMMDEKKIIIINLSKGRVGEANANLLGSMLITKIYLAAMSRADRSEKDLKNLPQFYLYVDEFQSFANESFADILSEARKYKLNLTMAHQYIEQMSEEVRAAVFGNVGSMIVFRVGAYDAEVLEKEFAPAFTVEDLVNLGFVQIYLKLMIDGVTSPPFSATTLPPIKKQDIMFKSDIIENSRAVFSTPRQQVEEAIKKWHEPVTLAPRSSANPVGPSTSQPRIESRPTQAPTPKPMLTQAPTQTVPIPTPKVEPIRTPPPQSQPVSLSSLQKDNRNKGPSGKNLSELKNLLKDVVEKAKSEKPEARITQKSELKQEPKLPPKNEGVKGPSQQAQQKNPSPEKEKPHEVPEDVLRKVLEV
jgi:energy-coupling factor transporter ATP-binding protein EcfA2